MKSNPLRASVGIEVLGISKYWCTRGEKAVAPRFKLAQAFHESAQNLWWRPSSDQLVHERALVYVVCGLAQNQLAFRPSLLSVYLT